MTWIDSYKNNRTEAEVRNDALEEAAHIAEKVSESNLNFNTAGDEAMVASSVAQVIANLIRERKS